MAKQQTLKTSKRVEVHLSDALEDIAARVAGAIGESLSLSETLGDLTREAAPLLDAEHVAPFADACAQLCEAAGLTGGSVKVYLSNMRGVLRAMVQGWKPDENVTTLRAMYDAIPAEYRGKGANKGNTTKRRARQPGSGKGNETVAQAAAADPSKIDRETAIRRLFGFYTEELADAVDYAVEHSGMFQTWARASAKAAMQPPVLKKAA